VVFELQREVTTDVWVSEGVLTTGASGIVEFKHLHDVANYRVIAVSPDGFYNTDSVYHFTTGTEMDDTYYLDWVFHPPIGNISFTKIDDGTGLALENIWFDLYRGWGSTKVLIDTQVSNASGLVTFSSIVLDGNPSGTDTKVSTNPLDRPTVDNTFNRANTRFTIEERWVPGYFPTAPKEFELNSSSPNHTPFTWKNFPADGVIILEVVDSETGERLRGVTFGLFAPNDPLLGGRELMSETSCDAGFVVFRGLPLGPLVPATFEELPDFVGELGAIEFHKFQLNNLTGYIQSDPIVTVLSIGNTFVEEDAPLDPVRRTNRPRNPSESSDELDGLDPSDPSNPDSDHYRRAALPRTGIESIMALLVIGLLTTLVATTAVIVIIRRQSAKDK